MTDIVAELDRWLADNQGGVGQPLHTRIQRAHDEIVRLQQAIESVRRDTLVRLHHEEANKFRAEARVQALEEAAKACDEHGHWRAPETLARRICDECSAAIRALKAPAP